VAAPCTARSSSSPYSEHSWSFCCLGSTFPRKQSLHGYPYFGSYREWALEQVSAKFSLPCPRQRLHMDGRLIGSTRLSFIVGALCRESVSRFARRSGADRVFVHRHW